jgi:hypothetical protein
MTFDGVKIFVQKGTEGVLYANEVDKCGVDFGDIGTQPIPYITEGNRTTVWVNHQYEYTVKE